MIYNQQILIEIFLLIEKRLVLWSTCKDLASRIYDKFCNVHILDPFMFVFI